VEAGVSERTISSVPGERIAERIAERSGAIA
jgi:hypothetical protein